MKLWGMIDMLLGETWLRSERTLFSFMLTHSSSGTNRLRNFSGSVTFTIRVLPLRASSVKNIALLISSGVAVISGACTVTGGRGGWLDRGARDLILACDRIEKEGSSPSADTVKMTCLLSYNEEISGSSSLIKTTKSRTLKRGRNTGYYGNRSVYMLILRNVMQVCCETGWVCPLSSEYVMIIVSHWNN